MRRFNLYLPVELFERIKLLSKFYNISIINGRTTRNRIYRYDRYKKKINKFIKMKGLGEEYGDNNF